MALQLPLQTQFGIELPAAYAKIGMFTGTKDGFSISVDYFANAAARDANTPIISSALIQLNTTAAQNVASMYAYLKTLPEFSGAIDC